MTPDTNRRAFLRGIAATVPLASVTGCLGLGGGGGTDTPDDAMGDDMTDGGMSGDGTDGMTESGMDGMTESGMDGMTESGMDGMTDSGMGGMTDSGMMTYEVTITNVSESGTLTTSMGSDHAVPLSPAAFAVHGDDAAAFASGEAAGGGLESLAEDGMPGTLAEEWSEAAGIDAAGTVAMPDSADEAGPLAPGDSYTVEVTGGHDHRLTVATMFVQSNDLFYAPDPAGIPLYQDGERTSGDVTDHLRLWDAGTEANEEPGAGENQAPRQSGVDTGEDEMGTVGPVAEVMDGYSYPDVSDVIEVRISPQSM